MVSIILNFPDEEHKDCFLGQVSDGAMEDICRIKPLNPEPADENGAWHKGFGGATEFEITMTEEWLR